MLQTTIEFVRVIQNDPSLAAEASDAFDALSTSAKLRKSISMVKSLSKLVSGISLSAALALAAPAALAQVVTAPVASDEARGMIMLDYEVIRAPKNASLDLAGFHAFNRMNDWLYLGVGGYAPLFKGEYGGFMALDVTAHVQRRLFGAWFADAGVSAGGGGGGKSRLQSAMLSGTGGFLKGYAGLGYDFRDISVGVNLARMKFEKSIIDSSQLNVYVQVPFSYAVGPYAGAGGHATRSSPTQEPSDTPGDGGENVLTLGSDNFIQRRPRGSNKSTINVAELQFSHFTTASSYWYFNAGVGYHGLPLYNQVLGGVGYQLAVSPRIALQAQVGLGSGGYSPENIDTGPGLLVHPKIAADYLIDRNFGVSLSAGYLFAPKASSKNYTVGLALNYHLRSGNLPRDDSAGSAAGHYNAYRINIFQQTEFDVRTRGVPGSHLDLLSAQLDSVVDEHVYIPVQVSIAYNAYQGYPGYGELAAGVGVQNGFSQGDRFQWFGQLLLGTNSQGAIVKTSAGVNVGVSDRLALYGSVGQTTATAKSRFKSEQIGVGLTYRFSVPAH